MTVWKLRPAIVLLLSGTLLAAYFAPSSTESQVALSDYASTKLADSAGGNPPLEKQKSVQSTPPAVLRIAPRDAAGEDPEPPLFAMTPPLAPAPAPTAEPAPMPPIAPPALPQAPPMPFRFIGRHIDGEQVTIFLQYNERSVAARIGNIVIDQYRVESVHEGTVIMRYLPLDVQQTLSMSVPN